MIRQTTFFSLILALAVGTVLFIVKNQVQELEAELQKTNREILIERTGFHVLRAEWSHLNEASRIRELVGKYLSLKPLDVTQFVSEKQISKLVTIRSMIVEGHDIKKDKAEFKSRIEKTLNRGASE